MRFATDAGLLMTLGLLVAVGCNSGSTGRDDYFTFMLDDFPVSIVGTDTTKGDAYVYVPWGPEAPASIGGDCWLIEFDLKGRAIREIDGVQTPDDADQQKGPTPETGTYAHYLGDQNGDVNPSSCLPLLDARFTFRDSAYVVSAELRQGFGDPGAVVPGDGMEFNWGGGRWALEGSSLGGPVYFWPYEYVPGTVILGTFPTEPLP